MKKLFGINLKDKLTTFAAILGGVCGLILLPPVAVLLPVAIGTYAVAGMALSGTIIGLLTGKNPDGTTKTPAQVTEANAGN